jgi:hypothetical protein
MESGGAPADSMESSGGGGLESGGAPADSMESSGGGGLAGRAADTVSAAERAAEGAGADDRRRGVWAGAAGFGQPPQGPPGAGVATGTGWAPPRPAGGGRWPAGLLPGPRAAETGWAGPITAEAARRLACDAGITRVITAGASQPLDVGRRTRTIPPALRTALTVRDRGCVWPGCDRPPPWTDAHHLIPWIDGGPTNLDNLALLCRRHHRSVHEGRWQLTRTPGGQWTASPPARGSPPAPVAA